MRAIREAQRSIVTKNMSKVNNIVEDEAFTFSSNEQVQQVEVVGCLLKAKLKTLEDIDQEVLSLSTKLQRRLKNLRSIWKKLSYCFSGEWGAAGN